MEEFPLSISSFLNLSTYWGSRFKKNVGPIYITQLNQVRFGKDDSFSKN